MDEFTQLRKGERLLKMRFDVSTDRLDCPRPLSERLAAKAGLETGPACTFGVPEELNAFAAGPATRAARPTENTCRKHGVNEGTVHGGIASLNRFPVELFLNCFHM